MELLDDAEIERRLADLDGSGVPHPLGGGAGNDPKYIKTLTAHAESLLEALAIENGLGTGLSPIDVLTRGFRPSDLVVITGFAHSGKTQLVNTMLCNNRDKRILFFSLDDPAEMLLAKLVAMDSGVPSERIEARVRAGDEGTKRLVRETAAGSFPNLLIVDDVIGIPAMQQAVDEARELWGNELDGCIIDYVEMMPGAAVSEDQAANVKVKMNALKEWAKVSNYPLIAVHQGTRSNAKPGEPITLLSLGFSGEQQATIIVGVRRKKSLETLDTFERAAHEDTVTLHVVKNKRPGGRCTHYEGIDFYLDPSTGMIGGDKPKRSVAAELSL